MKKNTNTIGIGERIRQIRGNESIPEFSDRLGIHKSTLVRYEKEESYPDAKVILRICNDCEIQPNWLLTGEGFKEGQQTPVGFNKAHNELREVLRSRLNDIIWRFAYYEIKEEETTEGVVYRGPIGREKASKIILDYIKGEYLPSDYELRVLCEQSWFDFDLVKSGRNPHKDYKLEVLDSIVRGKTQVTDSLLLREIIKIIEELIKKNNIGIPLSKKAELISIVYEDSVGTIIEQSLIKEKSERLINLVI